MKNYTRFLLVLPLMALLIVSCNKEEFNSPGDISQEIMKKVRHLGFNPDGIERVDAGFRVERDIILSHQDLEQTPADVRVPNAEHYSALNIVTYGANRVITVYIPQGSGGGKSSGFGPAYVQALDEAIRRFNDLNLDLSFQKVATPNADIVFTRLSRGYENQNLLVLSGFPSNGDPYGKIVLSGILESSYGLDVNEIASIITHGMGHCIGFRHTDYYDPSISCGNRVGTTYEGKDKFNKKVGAVPISGTPTEASFFDPSWMLSCTDGSNRPFTETDKAALRSLYLEN